MPSEHHFMQEAINIAKQGMLCGDGGPFGAVIVKNKEVIGRGWNRVLGTNDPSAHAEIVAIRDACSGLGSYRLDGCHIYVNCEPCPMCLAAIYWARIQSLTYGATRQDAADIGFDDNIIYQEVCRSPDKRSLDCRQYCRSEALKIMQIWSSLDNRQQY